VLKHKHLIVTADVKYPPKDTEYVEAWQTLVIKHIGMNLAKGEGLVKNPQAYYCDKNGNMGITSVAILETSHCAIHIWDEEYPAKMEFDLYSCSDFSPEDIMPFINLFSPTKIQYKFLDRENGLEEISHGEITTQEASQEITPIS